MDIQFIGTGGAFDWQVGNAAATVSFRGRRLLLDCGHSVFPKLMELGIADSFDALLLTHLHDDHCGSATTFIYAQYFLAGKRPFPVIAATPAFEAELRDYFRHAFGNVDTYVQFIQAAEIEGLTVLDTTGRHFPEMLTYGFVFEQDKQHIVFSGDIGDADFIFTELDRLGIQNATVFHDLSFHDIAPHAYYARLEPHLARHRIYGYHHNPILNPAENRIPIVHNCPEYRLY